ncbi:hypothetical protein GCM10025862_06260 [Arsenicicoccus piscis]|uniref:Uncharacterized protein n=1 Tax=Arsenicicoccus piscis TaxID=673954 RepID=A0ABQ6HKG9_9MICO|nr:hypothetical protein GCM10025862_06260 [Arsenicicoccus piscis]
MSFSAMVDSKVDSVMVTVLMAVPTSGAWQAFPRAAGKMEVLDLLGARQRPQAAPRLPWTTA